MSFVDSSLDNELYLFDPPESVWDRLLFLDHATWFDHKDMAVLVKAAEHTQAISREIPREAWLGLYASDTPLKETPPEGEAVIHSLFRRAEELPEWNQLRLMVGMDPVAAAFGAGHFATELIDRLPPEVKVAMESAQQAQDKLRQLQNQLEAARSIASSSGRPISGEDLQHLLGDLPGQIEQAKAQAASSLQTALEALNGAPARTNQSLAQALTSSAEDLSALHKAAAEFGMGWGRGASGGPAREQLDGLQALAEYLRKSPSVKLILETLGWAKALVTRERRKNTRGHETFTHFKVQDLNLETLAPDELVSMIAFDRSSPIYLDFLCRALDGDLLHAQFEGQDFAGRGPIVFLRDESGSMRGARRATACALQLALMVDARREGRRFISIPFSDVGQFRVYDPGDKPEPQSLMEHLDTTYGGGTEPYGPLTAAIRLILEDPSLRQGDILIITDGDFGKPPEAFLRDLELARQQPGLKVVAVVINGHPAQAEFADKVVMISDIVRERERLAEAIAPLL
ncbi:MAG: hypothetical protein FJZ97_01040 [Chloroflexi bacterium]|nr:hypothetical protein [Chloroflexota bacterium]